MIVPKGDEAYHVYMIDLALCWIREEEESDAKQGSHKWEADEEG